MRDVLPTAPSPRRRTFAFIAPSGIRASQRQHPALTVSRGSPGRESGGAKSSRERLASEGRRSDGGVPRAKDSQEASRRGTDGPRRGDRGEDGSGPPAGRDGDARVARVRADGRAEGPREARDAVRGPQHPPDGLPKRGRPPVPPGDGCTVRRGLLPSGERDQSLEPPGKVRRP